MHDGEMKTFDESDERPHAVGGELGWAESYAFDLYDPREGLGGCLRLAVRPNEGSMEVGLHFLLSDGGLIAARHVRAVRANVAELEVGDVRFDVLAPLARWKIAYDGPAHSLAAARDAGKAEAWRKSRVERLGVDLVLESTSPALGAAERFAQAVRWTGTVWVSGDEYASTVAGCGRAPGVRATGSPPTVRDRSRFPSATTSRSSPPRSRRRRKTPRAGAAGSFATGARSPVAQAELSTEADADGHPKSLALAVSDTSGARHELRGEILQIAPLPRARSGRQALVCEAVARFTYGEESAFGFATYVDPIDASGRPLASD
jgi:hypothetical protein